jgi:ribose-phosphate pyrophosphokinase
MIIHLDRINKIDSMVQQWVYPDGVSTQVRLTPEGMFQVRSADQLKIVANLRSPQDIINLIHLLDAVRNVFQYPIELILPYLPYSRADRRFSMGDTFGLEVFLKMIQLFDPVFIKTFDIHSVVGCQLNPKVKNFEPWKQVLQTVAKVMNSNQTTRLNILLPDEGAIQRYPKLKDAGNDQMVRALTASKKRDPQTGVLSGFIVPLRDQFLDAPVLVIDDLCDGGGTFIGIAQELRKAGITQPLYLYVSHGIFSKGLEVLFQHFDQIFTTNSFDQAMYLARLDNRLKVYDVVSEMTE